MKRGWLIFGAVFGALLALGALVGGFSVWRVAHWEQDTTEFFRPFVFGGSILCTVQFLGGVFLLWRAGKALRRLPPAIVSDT
jgi:hypothetical protein